MCQHGVGALFDLASVRPTLLESDSVVSQFFHETFLFIVE